MALTKTDNSGMTVEEVRSVQSRLKQIGIDPGPIDGIMGPMTESAIIAFKRKVGLRARPYVGPITWKKLHNNPVTNELPWIAEARKVKDLHEIYDNKELAEWLSSDHYALGDPAQLPWCGDFIETAIRLTLPQEKIPENPYWALNWREFGIPCPPSYGCVASIKRQGGGHVMFIVGQDAGRYYALGGNQANRVSIVPVDKSRFVPQSFRWPSTYHVKPNSSMPHINSDVEANTREE